MAKKSKKKGISPILTILITFLALAMVTLAVVLYAYMKGTTKTTQERYNPNLISDEIATEQLSIKINMESCMIPVGTKVTVTATIYPSGSTSGVIWNSSDQNVITIDENGNLQAVGVGVAALTANFASVYDSIAIECVADENNSMLSLPSYSLFVGDSANETQTGTSVDRETASAQDTTQSNTGDAPTTAANTPGTSATAPNAQTATTAANVSSTAATTSNAQTSATTSNSSNTATTASNSATSKTQATTAQVLQTTQEYDGVKILSTQIAADLPEYGFDKYLDNTYVYQENNTYLGEIIISSNMTHIYIKERSAGFDTAISEVLNVLLPESASSIWNTYMTASTDQTMSADGRVVRVVVPSDSGHSQIVIYN